MQNRSILTTRLKINSYKHMMYRCTDMYRYSKDKTVKMSYVHKTHLSTESNGRLSGGGRALTFLVDGASLSLGG